MAVDGASAARRRESTGIRASVLALVCVVLAFVTTTSLFLVRSRGIGDAADILTSNAIPSIHELVEARAEVALLRVRVEDHVGNPHSNPAARALVWRTVGELRKRMSRYVGLPSYPGERRLQGELLTSVDQYIHSVARVLSTRDGGDVPRAKRLMEHELNPAAERVERVLTASEMMNVNEIKMFAVRMESIRAQSRRDLLILNGLSVVLAGILLTWVVRSGRRYRALQERYLRDSEERAREMEAFAGRVAHDILSPLGSASLALDLLADSSDPEVSRVATRGIRGIARVRATVDGLFEFARAGARSEATICSDLAEVAEEVAGGLRESAAAAGVALEVRTDGHGLTVNANRGVVMSILTNLIQNAIKYIGDESDKSVTVRICEQGALIHVDVRDTGPGVPAEMRHTIFEPYFRARDHAASGLGLGLATVKRLVEAHGGQVGVSSSTGSGSVFWFELPRSSAAPSAK